MNLKAYRQKSGYGKRVIWSRNAVAAKARRRIERASSPTGMESESSPVKYAKPHTLTLSAHDSLTGERVTFGVVRYDEKRFMARGRVEAASTIGKRIAQLIQGVL